MCGDSTRRFRSVQCVPGAVSSVPSGKVLNAKSSTRSVPVTMGSSLLPSTETRVRPMPRMGISFTTPRSPRSMWSDTTPEIWMSLSLPVRSLLVRTRMRSASRRECAKAAVTPYHPMETSSITISPLMRARGIRMMGRCGGRSQPF